MNIKSMLVRLQSAMGRNDLVEQMVLLPQQDNISSGAAKSTKPVNLVVGYDRSPSSQTALDVTLWIAHQTRLVTKASVTVHVVYVVDDDRSSNGQNFFNSTDASSASIDKLPLQFSGDPLRSATGVSTKPRREAIAARPRVTSIDPSYFRAAFYQNDALEQADRVLSQARNLAEEWQGSFKAHLRFGCVSDELKKVVESEAAVLLFLGCNSATHPIVRKLGSDFPCAVLGIPTTLNPQEGFNH